eukprot:gene21107-27349_t
MKRFNIPIISTRENDHKDEGNSLTSPFRKINILTKVTGSGSNNNELSAADQTKRFIGNLSTGIFGSSQNLNESKVKQAKQLSTILSLLEDVKLQCPVYHSGLVVAVSSAILAPLTHEGIRFTWYRLGNNTGDQFYTVDESSKAWYAPTIDDIGCKICVQCEDSYQQGFSRYVECGPIEADPLLCTLSESILSNNYFECQDVSVSLGLVEIEGSESSSEIITVQDRPSILESVNQPFLQLDGRSSVIVDSHGLFVSIPVKSKDKDKEKDKEKGVKSGLRQSSRGLRISPSPHIKVRCTQPASIVIDLPIRSSSTNSTNNEPAEDKAMESFLGSSTLQIPWVYEGVHSPEALSLAAEASVEDAEEDAIAFASTVCSLTELVSSFPESTTMMKICIACSDRMQRDILVSGLRILVSRPVGITDHERRQLLPWIDRSITDKPLDGLSDNELKLQKKIRSIEEENVSLKKERNELTSQLMLQRESLAHKRKSQVIKDKEEVPDTNNSDANNVDEDTEEYRQLLSEVIELENKLTLANKRELELSQRYSDLELRNHQILTDNESIHKRIEELTIQYTIIKHERDLQDKKSINTNQKLIDLQNQLDSITSTNLTIEQLQSTLSYRESEFDKLKQDHDKTTAELLAITEMFDELNERYKRLDNEKKGSSDSNLEIIQRLQLDLQDKESIITDLSNQLSKITLLNNELNNEIELLSHKAVELEQAETKNQKLQGEINHLHQKNESQLKDSKKTLKENSFIIAEYEKALARKSDECNALQTLVYELQDQLKQRRDSDNSFNPNGSFFSLPIAAPSISIDPLINILTRPSRSNSIAPQNISDHDTISEGSTVRESDSSQRKFEDDDCSDEEDDSVDKTTKIKDSTISSTKQLFGSFYNRRPSIASANTDEESSQSTNQSAFAAITESASNTAKNFIQRLSINSTNASPTAAHTTTNATSSNSNLDPALQGEHLARSAAAANEADRASKSQGAYRTVVIVQKSDNKSYQGDYAIANAER